MRGNKYYEVVADVQMSSLSSHSFCHDSKCPQGLQESGTWLADCGQTSSMLRRALGSYRPCSKWCMLHVQRILCTRYVYTTTSDLKFTVYSDPFTWLYLRTVRFLSFSVMPTWFERQKKRVCTVKPAGYFMYHKAHVSVLYGSQNKRLLFPSTALTDWFL
jgi:hypothetical protein